MRKHEPVNANDILQLVRTRLVLLRPLVDECQRLEAALEALGGPVTPTRPSLVTRDPEAPYGRKADGTPRRRPGRSRKPAPVPEAVTLQVVTGGVPAVKDDAVPAYVTQEPA